VKGLAQFEKHGFFLRPNGRLGVLQAEVVDRLDRQDLALPRGGVMVGGKENGFNADLSVPPRVSLLVSWNSLSLGKKTGDHAAHSLKTSRETEFVPARRT